MESNIFARHGYKSIKDEESIVYDIGAGKDEAFNFYYEDNLELLHRMGTKLEFFSPIHDKELPKHIHGLLLGGGYPENYGKALEVNLSMKECINKAITEGMPCLAECGGFPHLYYYSNVDIRYRFLLTCNQFRQEVSLK